ncbi:MAG TPA: Rieske 2Fe-2S domain-containing protein [Candidatus Sulfopaludibacter sp.]|jgi:3-phenylpropionate/trans-cinnamate dioxygenase ferredoxin component|nr:Rieske 2Fe-2S domain-containing protein [Candidatus Sulfopaludibacter sp.]
MGWIKVCENSSLKNGDIIGYDYNDNKNRLLIAKIKDKLFATDGICTHQYADLSNGFLNEEEKTITCPLHMSAFNLDNGIALNPPAEEPLKTFKVISKEDGVYVLIEES